ncbi:Diacylglycerol kinase catalytic region [uncultured Paludibacter sp.]|nr:Diacylglycerol kinase catalytic region [uncultured Paludibacter sp.]
MKKRIGFIINPISGTSNHKQLPDIIREKLDLNQFEYNILFTKEAGDGTKLAAGCVKDNYYAVIAVGGDGTMNEIAKSLINTNTALGIIPAGSGNGLARHLSIPINAAKAIQHLNYSEIIKIDYGLANDRPFFCTCGTGFDAYVSMEFAKAKRRGLITYLEKMVTTYRNYKLQNYQLIGEDITFRNKAFLITFANASQWGNNAYIAPQASVQDGLLDVSVMSNFPDIAIPSVLLQLFTKTIHKDLHVTTFRTKDITLLREAPGPFHLDGEPYQEGEEIKIKIIQEGLKVLVKKRY